MLTCPSEEQLHAFQLGNLPAPVLDALAQHMEQCPECEARAEAMDRATDPVLSALRSPSPSAAPPPSSETEHSSAWPKLRGYRLLALLGRGGMGVVYQAQQLDLNRVVALKMLPMTGPVGAEALARLQNEAEAIARLQHPNLVQIHDVGRQEGWLYLALEHVSGGSLRNHLQGKPRAPEDAAEFVETLARAMHYAHECGIVHRDLKPDNILLTREGVPKITDFGLAKWIDRDLNLTRTGVVAGTPGYMAPEQADGNAAAFGPPLDVYSLGVILYELLTGRVPFEGTTTGETLQMVRLQEPLSPRHLQPKLPRDLETICLKCLEKEPESRYRSALALASDLGRFRKGEPIVARPAATFERVRKWSRRQPMAAALTAGIVAMAALGFAGIIYEWQDAESHRRQAEAARDAVLREQSAAEEERRNAVRAREDAETGLYFSRIAQARLEWQLNFDGDRARALLDSCPLDRRGWEWRYLDSLLHADLKTFEAHPSGWVWSVAFSPNGRWVASAGGGNPFYASHGPESIKPGEAILWDSTRGERHQVLRGHSHVVSAAAFTPDGKFLASASFDGTIRFWDVDTGKDRTTLRTGASVLAIAFTPDGTRLVSADGARTVTVRDLDGKPTLVLKGHRLPVACLAVSPDGKRCISGSKEGEQGELILWDLVAGKEERRLGDAGVSAVAFSPDGLRVVAAGRSVAILDLAGSRAVQTLAGHRGWVHGVAFRPDGLQIATAGADQTVRLWNARTGAEDAVQRGHRTRLRSIAYHPSGRYLASGDENGTMKWWDATRHPDHATFHPGEPDVRVAEALAFTSESREVQVLLADGRVEVHDISSGAVRRERAVDLLGRWMTPATLANFTPDGQRLATVTRRGWQVRIGGGSGPDMVVPATDATVEQRHTHPIHNLALSANGLRMATAARHAGKPAREIKVWDTRTGRLLFDTRVADIDSPRLHGGLALSSDGRWLAHDGYPEASARSAAPARIQVVDLASDLADPARRTLSVAGHPLLALAFGGNGTVLAAADSQAHVYIWDLRSDNPRPITLASHAFQLAFHPDGTRLAAVNREQVTVWDVATGQQLLVLRGARPAPSDRGFNPQVAWSADGRRLAAGNWDRTVTVWDGFESTGDFAARRARAERRAFRWHLEHAAASLHARDAQAFAFHWGPVSRGEPPDGLSRRWRASLHASRAEWRAAADDVDRALALASPPRAQDWVFASGLQLLAGDARAALRTSEGMRKRYPRDSLSEDETNHVIRALVLAKANDAGDIQKWADALPANARGWHTRSLIRYSVQDYPEAIVLAKRSLEQESPADLQGLNFILLALAHHRLGQGDEAERWSTRAAAWARQRTGSDALAELVERIHPCNALEFLLLYREHRDGQPEP